MDPSSSQSLGNVQDIMDQTTWEGRHASYIVPPRYYCNNHQYEIAKMRDRNLEEEDNTNSMFQEDEEWKTYLNLSPPLLNEEENNSQMSSMLLPQSPFSSILGQAYDRLYHCKEAHLEEYNLESPLPNAHETFEEGDHGQFGNAILGDAVYNIAMSSRCHEELLTYEDCKMDLEEMCPMSPQSCTGMSSGCNEELLTYKDCGVDLEEMCPVTPQACMSLECHEELLTYKDCKVEVEKMCPMSLQAEQRCIDGLGMGAPNIGESLPSTSKGTNYNNNNDPELSPHNASHEMSQDFIIVQMLSKIMSTLEAYALLGYSMKNNEGDALKQGPTKDDLENMVNVGQARVGRSSRSKTHFHGVTQHKKTKNYDGRIWISDKQMATDLIEKHTTNAHMQGTNAGVEMNMVDPKGKHVAELDAQTNVDDKPMNVKSPTRSIKRERKGKQIFLGGSRNNPTWVAQQVDRMKLKMHLCGQSSKSAIDFNFPPVTYLDDMCHPDVRAITNWMDYRSYLLSQDTDIFLKNKRKVEGHIGVYTKVNEAQTFYYAYFPMEDKNGKKEQIGKFRTSFEAAVAYDCNIIDRGFFMDRRAFLRHLNFPLRNYPREIEKFVTLKLEGKCPLPTYEVED